MLICPNGHGPRAGRFCPDCGGELVAAASGDTLRVRSHDLQASASVNPTFILPGAAGGGGPPALVKCPKCGHRKNEADVFDCQGPCGRANLCHRHFDEEYDLCGDCAALRRGDAEREAARQAKLQADLADWRARAERAEQALVQATQRHDAAQRDLAAAQARWAEAQTAATAAAAASQAKLTAAEKPLAEWRARAERAEQALARAEAEVKAKAEALAQVEAEVKAKVAALTQVQAALAEWRGRAEKAEGQLAEIARREREAEAARQAEIARQAQAEAEAKAEAARRAAEAVGAGSPRPAWQRIGIELIKIPAGEFLYGEKKEKVVLPEYWLAKTPVTNTQYKAFVEATGHQSPGHWSGGQIPQGKENHPVVNVSWDDAQAFCQWAGLRLPAEPEWEKAARGPSTGSGDGREYPWGNTEPTDKLCNFNQNIKDTTPVGRYSPVGDSPYGLVDMAGNVWEWCVDWYDSEHKYRVLRGGSWYHGQVGVRAAFRGWFLPEYGYDFLGFRCAARPDAAFLNPELLGF